MKKNIISITKPIVTLLIILCITFILSQKFFRIDLSSEKRYSLSDISIKTLDNLKDTITINVYLSGDLPLLFKRLEQRIDETLSEFEVYGNNHIVYKFTNPYKKYNSKQRKDLYEDLSKLGIKPTSLKVKTKEGFTQQMIYPGATIRCKDKILGVNFLLNKIGFSPEQNLNASFEGLEYKLINSISNITKEKYNKIAFIQGHGELSKFETADIFSSLYEFYDVKYLTIHGDKTALNNFDMIIIAGADSTFNDADKKIIDKFIMEGGKSLWLVDGINARLEDLSYRPMTFGLANNNDLMSMLFSYGVRVNYNLMMDRQCLGIPVNISLKGEKPNFVSAPWLFSPLLTPIKENPITKNINLVKADFISSIDTINYSPKVKKTILLQTSLYSKIVNPPMKLSLDWINKKFPNSFFTSYKQITGVLLEGNFKSAVINGFSKSEESKTTKMIVISDASIIKNKIKMIGKRPRIYPLGYDKYSNQTFGNKDFILNCINYLSSESGLINLRGRSFKLRLLNKSTIEDNKSLILILNTLVPIILIILIGFIFYYIRKKLYS